MRPLPSHILLWMKKARVPLLKKGRVITEPSAQRAVKTNKIKWKNPLNFRAVGFRAEGVKTELPNGSLLSDLFRMSGHSNVSRQFSKMTHWKKNTGTIVVSRPNFRVLSCLLDICHFRFYWMFVVNFWNRFLWYMVFKQT